MNWTTPFDVLKHSPAGFDYPTDGFCDLIPVFEQDMRRDCLGKPLADYLTAHLVAYPETFSEWDSSVPYSIGDVVVRNTCTYISKTNANQTDPLTSANWEILKRFDTDGANHLWEKYLRQIMAYKVFMATLNSTTYRSGAGGMTVNVSDRDSGGVRAVNKAELLMNLTQYNGLLQMMTANMIEWLTDNYKSEELPLPACAGNCDVPANRSRRIAFRDEDD